MKDMVKRWKVSVFSLQETKVQEIDRKMEADMWGRTVEGTLDTYISRLLGGPVGLLLRGMRRLWRWWIIGLVIS